MTTLVELRNQVRQRADMENSTFVSDAELNNYINLSYAELYDLIIDKHGEDYYIQDQVYTGSPSQDTFALPSNFYKLRGVDLLTSAGQAVTLRRFEFSERNRFTNVSQAVDGDYRYRLRGSNLVLTPALSAQHQLKLWYIPKPIKLVADSDAIDGVNGFEEYVIIDAAIKCRIKEETDTSTLIYQKQSIETRINRMADNRDANEPSRIVDININSRDSYFNR